jgi:hypothetical protein
MGGEVVLGREAADVADLAEQLGCQHRANAEQLHQAGLRLDYCFLDVRLYRSDPPVQVAHVGDQVFGDLVAGGGRHAGRTCLAEQQPVVTVVARRDAKRDIRPRTTRGCALIASS